MNTNRYLQRLKSASALVAFGICVLVNVGSGYAQSKTDKVYWQAHRGGGAHEAPDNTIGAAMYTWNLGGIPEVDVRTTKDDVIICLHDATLARTTTAPQRLRNIKVKELDFAEVRKWDAGIGFSDDFKGEVVPMLEEVFQKMQEDQNRLVYLDIKDVDLAKLGQLIDQYRVNEQILIASPRQSDCKTLKSITKGLRTMIWIGGTAEEIKSKFDKVVQSEFDGVDQVQLHLHDKATPDGSRYQLEPSYLASALTKTRDAEIDLEVFPFHFDDSSLTALLELGIRWYATDEPKRFTDVVQGWRSSN
ncbi:glycerophosphodiester phosphodiesterase family protein [Stieleria sp. JC731]|uniref:glycerophosphodiester phosphodiesterase n=1 Tax=Pirellulaceae TaxID=2691357 RepID=UPI001E3BA9A0|nr:glycerophosphodiester phosphodiesterase family protein [Stieleria sp. JC731]MCC9600559.1 glycerophosphodiester phosphodiesterase family protein [Stieleria sp. JC731]